MENGPISNKKQKIKNHRKPQYTFVLMLFRQKKTHFEINNSQRSETCIKSRILILNGKKTMTLACNCSPKQQLNEQAVTFPRERNKNCSAENNILFHLQCKMANASTSLTSSSAYVDEQQQKN